MTHRPALEFYGKDDGPLAAEIRPRIVEQARELELDFFYSAKGHFNAAHHWEKFGFCLGLTAVFVSSAGAIFSLSPGADLTAVCPILLGAESIIVSCLTALKTFTKPSDKSHLHKTAGNRFNSLRDQTRRFYLVECFLIQSPDKLFTMLDNLSRNKDKANSESPSIPVWAYRRAIKERPREAFLQAQIELLQKFTSKQSDENGN